jgi:salicylate hydroxylase
MDMAGYIGHRGDYHEVFLHAVRNAEIPTHMSSEIVAFNENKPSVSFANGRGEVADLIVGADGIKSRTRELVLGFTNAPKSSGYSCVNIWIGDDTHLVKNTLRDGKEFNWIGTRKLSHEANMEIKESWFQEGNMDEVRKHIATVNPRIAAAVLKTTSCLDWKICYRDPLPTWVSKSHKVALPGDSCHPHLPIN